jgi:hypothetical protein
MEARPMSRKQQIKSNLKRKTTLPPQLQKRVQSGAVTGSQARQTFQERQTFKKAFGDDWRTQVFGKGGAKGVTGSFGRSQVAADRSQALAKARAKLGGGVGVGKAPSMPLRVPNGKPFTPPRRGLGPLPLKKRKLKY